MHTMPRPGTWSNLDAMAQGARQKLPLKRTMIANTSSRPSAISTHMTSLLGALNDAANKVKAGGRVLLDVRVVPGYAE